MKYDNHNYPPPDEPPPGSRVEGSFGFDPPPQNVTMEGQEVGYGKAVPLPHHAHRTPPTQGILGLYLVIFITLCLTAIAAMCARSAFQRAVQAEGKVDAFVFEYGVGEYQERVQ